MELTTGKNNTDESQKYHAEWKKKSFIKEYSMNPLTSFRTGKINLWWTNQNSDRVVTGHEKTFGGEGNILYL